MSRVNDAMGRAVGDGEIDWPLFLRLYHDHGRGVPIVMEYVNAGNFLEIRERLYRAGKTAGGA